jgi:O-antigen ligase
MAWLPQWSLELMTSIGDLRLAFSKAPSILDKLPLGAWSRRASVTFYLCAGVIVASAVLGGGTRGGFLSDSILQLMAIPLLLWALWQAFEVPTTRQLRLALWFCLAITLLPIIQLVPLPPWLWTALPNRQPVAEGFEILGHAPPWMPISVSPEATWLSVVSLVPPLAIFFGTVLLTYRERRGLSLVVLTIGIISVFMGLIQVAQGAQSPLRFFAITNPTEAVGFFANRNHFAALLYCLLLLAAAWTTHAISGIKTPGVGEEQSYHIASIAAAICGFTVIVLFLAGETMARSRAGLGLAMIALCAAIAFNFSNRKIDSWITSNKLLLGGIVLALTFSLQFGLYRILERFSDPLQDARIMLFRNTVAAAKAFMPLGSGLGTFVPVYAMFEKPEDAAQVYMNHAHNDLLEAWLESGILGIVLLVLFLVWLIWRSVEIWRNPPERDASELDWFLARAATVLIALIGIHSLFDYPLRTEAIMTIAAFGCALLIEPPIKSKAGELQSQLTQKLTRLRKRPVLSPAPVPALSRQPPKARPAIATSDTSPVSGRQPTSPPAIATSDTSPISGRQPTSPPAIATSDASSLLSGQQPTSPPALATSDASSPRRRWGEDMVWPEAWTNPPNQQASNKVAKNPKGPADAS